MEQQLINTAQKISDVGAFYFIVAFIILASISIIALIIAMFKTLKENTERQQKLFEELVKESLNKIPVMLEEFRKTMQQEYVNFELKQKDLWSGIDKAIKGVYSAIIQSRELSTKQLKEIAKVVMNGTILSISYEINNIITKNNIYENIDDVMNSIETIVKYEVEKGREFLKNIGGKDNLLLKYAFSKTDKMRENAILDLQGMFIEAAKEIGEISRVYKESNDLNQKIKLLNRKCKIYLDLRARITYYVEKEKSLVIQMINEIGE